MQFIDTHDLDDETVIDILLIAFFYAQTNVFNCAPVLSGIEDYTVIIKALFEGQNIHVSTAGQSKRPKDPKKKPEEDPDRYRHIKFFGPPQKKTGRGYEHKIIVPFIFSRKLAFYFLQKGKDISKAFTKGELIYNQQLKKFPKKHSEKVNAIIGTLKLKNIYCVNNEILLNEVAKCCGINLNTGETINAFFNRLILMACLGQQYHADTLHFLTDKAAAHNPAYKTQLEACFFNIALEHLKHSTPAALNDVAVDAIKNAKVVAGAEIDKLNHYLQSKKQTSIIKQTRLYGFHIQQSFSGYFTFVPQTESFFDADCFVALPNFGNLYGLIDKLVTALVYESKRHNWTTKPIQLLHYLVQKCNPYFGQYTLADYQKHGFAVEHLFTHYYGDDLSDDSDSEAEEHHLQSTTARQRRGRRKKRLEQFAEFNALKTEKEKTEAYYIGWKGAPWKSGQAHADLQTLKIWLRNKEFTMEKLGRLDTTFYLVHYRGIFYTTTNHNIATRRLHRKLDETQMPVFSSAVYAAQASTNIIDTIFNYLRDKTFESKLLGKAEELRLRLEALRQTEPVNLQIGSGENRQFSNTALALQHLYTNDYHGFIAYLEDCLNHQQDDALGTHVREQLLNARVPYVSCGESPSHALRYAYGLKYYEGHGDSRLRPRWNREGRAERPYSGKVYIILHSLQDYLQANPNHVLNLNEAGEVAIGNLIVAEREVAFASYLPKSSVIVQHVAKYPSFKDGSNDGYKSIYTQKYGLSKEKYLDFKKRIRKSAPHSAPRKAAKFELGEHLCAYYQHRLMQIAAHEVAKRNGQILFAHQEELFDTKVQYTHFGNVGKDAGKRAQQEKVKAARNKKVSPLLGAVSPATKVVKQRHVGAPVHFNLAPGNDPWLISTIVENRLPLDLATNQDGTMVLFANTTSRRLLSKALGKSAIWPTEHYATTYQAAGYNPAYRYKLAFNNQCLWVYHQHRQELSLTPLTDTHSQAIPLKQVEEFYHNLNNLILVYSGNALKLILASTPTQTLMTLKKAKPTRAWIISVELIACSYAETQQFFVYSKDSEKEEKIENLCDLIVHYGAEKNTLIILTTASLIYYDLTTFTVTANYIHNLTNASTLACPSNNVNLVAVAASNDIHILVRQQPDLIQEHILQKHTDKVTQLVFSDRNDLLYSASEPAEEVYSWSMLGSQQKSGEASTAPTPENFDYSFSKNTITQVPLKKPEYNAPGFNHDYGMPPCVLEAFESGEIKNGNHFILNSYEFIVYNYPAPHWRLLGITESGQVLYFYEKKKGG